MGGDHYGKKLQHSDGHLVHRVRPHTGKPPVAPEGTKAGGASRVGGHKKVGEGGNGWHAKKTNAVPGMKKFLPPRQILTKGAIESNRMVGPTESTEEVKSSVERRSDQEELPWTRDVRNQSEIPAPYGCTTALLPSVEATLV